MGIILSLIVGFFFGVSFIAVCYAVKAKEGFVFYQIDEQRSGWAKRSELEGTAWIFPSKQPKNT